MLWRQLPDIKEKFWRNESKNKNVLNPKLFNLTWSWSRQHKIAKVLLCENLNERWSQLKID